MKLQDNVLKAYLKNVLFISGTPCGGKTTVSRRLAEKYGLLFVPLQDLLLKVNEGAPEDYWLRDGVHPTPAGHELIKNEWLKAFEQLKA